MSKSDLMPLGIKTNILTKEYSNRHIVCISGGLASAYVAWWVKNNIKGEMIYYFNDVKWEHPDLYRFLDDLEKALDIKITRDNDGRTPEQVFYDQHMLGSNRSPLCSKILKAERLQEFIKKGDTVYFGIDVTEIKRTARISIIYDQLGCITRFPLVENMVIKSQFNVLMRELNIEIPQMYKDGFKHNNCAGGCVRAGKKQWVSLLRKYPEIYAERERVEIEFNEKIKPKAYAHFMKDISLTELREEEAKGVDFKFEPEEWSGECVGICGKLY